MANAREAARAALSSFKLGTGVSPFAMASSSHASERSGDLLTQASSILTAFTCGFHDARRLTGAGQESLLSSLNSDVLAEALEGIGSLVDLANFLLEE